MDKISQTPYLLLTPGPVSIPSAILNTLSQPMIHHRSPSFKKLFIKTTFLLKKLFQTQQEVLILNSSGTGAMAAAILNTLSPQDTILVVSCGKFGQRWGEIATAYNLKVLYLNVPWGQTVCVKKLSAILNANVNIKAVLAQACETSTGVLNPIKSMAHIIQQKPNTLFIVDAISALGAVNLPMDLWKIDILIGGSQKTFCLPAGMSFISLSKKAWEFNKSSKLPVYYFDLQKEKQFQKIGQTAFSTNVSFIRALHMFLSPLEHPEGLNKLAQKSEQLSKFTVQFCKKWNLKIFSSNLSPSVTTIALPKNIDGVKLKNIIEQKHRIVFGGGQDQLKGRIIRIGHLGDISQTHLQKGLQCLLLELQNPLVKITTPQKKEN